MDGNGDLPINNWENMSIQPKMGFLCDLWWLSWFTPILVIVKQNPTKISGGSHLAGCRVDHSRIGEAPQWHPRVDVAASLGRILTICHLGVMTPFGCRLIAWVKTRRWQGPTTGGENPQAVTLSGFENPCWHLHGCYIYRHLYSEWS